MNDTMRLRSKLLRVAAIAALPFAIAGVGLAVMRLVDPEEYPIERVWSALFGNPDLGPVAFEQLRRRSTPNDALMCPATLCPASADGVAPLYLASEAALREALSSLAMADSGTSLVFRQDGPGRIFQDRYIARSPRLRFPDTIDVRFIPVTESTSTMALYSRSQIGHGDGGVNAARLRRWTDPTRLGLAVVQTASVPGEAAPDTTSASSP